MDIVAAESTNLFIGSEAAPRQVVRIVLRAPREHPASPPRCASRAPVSEPMPRSASGRSAKGRPSVGPPANRGAGRPRAARRPRGGSSRGRRGGRRDPGRGRPPRCRGRRRGRPGDPAPALPAHRRGARLADVPGLALPLRPGLVEHPGGLHRDLGRDDPVPGAVPGARPGARQVAPRDGPARSRLQVRPRRARLPQAVLGRLSRGPRLRPPAPGRRPARVRRRHVQRAEHEPDERGIDDPQRDLRDRLPARRPGRRPGHRLAARRVRARPAVPRDHGRRRRVLELVGSRPVPRMGSQLGPRPRPDGRSPSWLRATIRGCSSRWSSTGSRPAGAPCSRASWPTTIRPAGGWTPRRRSRRPRPRSIACSPSSPRWRRPRTSCCPSAPTTRRPTSGSARSSATGTAATSGRSSRWPSRANTSTPCAPRRPPRVARSPRRRAT